MGEPLCKGKLYINKPQESENKLLLTDIDAEIDRRAQLDGDDTNLSCDEFGDGSWFPYFSSDKWNSLKEYLERREIVWNFGIGGNSWDNVCGIWKEFPFEAAGRLPRSKEETEKIYEEKRHPLVLGMLLCSNLEEHDDDYKKENDVYQYIPERMVESYVKELLAFLGTGSAGVSFPSYISPQDPDIRRYALNAIKNILKTHDTLPDNIIDLLSEHILKKNEPDQYVRREAVWTISSLGSHINENDEREDRKAPLKFSDKFFKNVLSFLAENKKDGIPDACDMLGIVDKPSQEIVDELSEYLVLDSDNDIRSSSDVLELIGKWADAGNISDASPVVEKLIPCIQGINIYAYSGNDSKEEMLALLRGFGVAINHRHSIEILCNVISKEDNKDHDLRSAVIDSLAKMAEDVMKQNGGFLTSAVEVKAKDIVDLLYKDLFVQDDAVKVLASASLALGKFGRYAADCRVIERLKELALTSSSLEVRKNAVWSLGRLGPVAARKDVFDLLDTATKESALSQAANEAAGLLKKSVDEISGEDPAPSRSRREALENIVDKDYKVRLSGYRYLYQKASNEDGGADEPNTKETLLAILELDSNDHFPKYINEDKWWAIVILSFSHEPETRSMLRRSLVSENVPNEVKIRYIQEYFTNDHLSDPEKTEAIKMMRLWHDFLKKDYASLSDDLKAQNKSMYVTIEKEIARTALALSCKDENFIDEFNNAQADIVRLVEGSGIGSNEDREAIKGVTGNAVVQKKIDTSSDYSAKLELYQRMARTDPARAVEEIDKSGFSDDDKVGILEAVLRGYKGEASVQVYIDAARKVVEKQKKGNKQAMELIYRIAIGLYPDQVKEVVIPSLGGSDALSANANRVLEETVKSLNTDIATLSFKVLMERAFTLKDKASKTVLKKAISDLNVSRKGAKDTADNSAYYGSLSKNVSMMAHDTLLVRKELSLGVDEIGFLLDAIKELEVYQPDWNFLEEILKTEELTVDVGKGGREIAPLFGNLLSEDKVGLFLETYDSVNSADKRAVLILSQFCTSMRDKPWWQALFVEIINRLLDSRVWNTEEWRTILGRLKADNSNVDFLEVDLYDYYEKAKKEPSYAVNYARATGYLNLRGLKERLIRLFGDYPSDDAVRAEIAVAMARLGLLDELEKKATLMNKEVRLSIYSKAIESGENLDVADEFRTRIQGLSK